MIKIKIKIKIKTSGDLKEIKETALISPAYYRAVAEQFWQLVTTFCPPGSKPEEYSLEQDGYLVILTADDDHWCLEEAGLTFGLINSWPEYIEVLNLEDGQTVYRLAVLYDNDYLMFFYLNSTLYQEDQKFKEFIYKFLSLEGDEIACQPNE